MTKQYAKAPIREALIDIQVQLPSGVNLTTLDALADQVAESYPRKRHRVYFESQFETEPAASATSRHAVKGYALHSADNLQVFQARLDGFTFSRLRPYENWESLRSEGKRLWEMYRDATRPTSINRVALRYINQFDIPLPMADFREYLLTVPEVSGALPQALSGMFMQLQFPQDFGGVLVLRQAVTPADRPDHVSVLLDFDVFQQDLELADERELWALFEKLRDRKNEFFEGSITDKARALFV